MSQPGDFAHQVKSATDIVRVVGDYVRLKKSSGSRYMGLCPFHQEKTPSFSVNANLQFYYCFGCGATGDVFKFVMETDKITFPEAVKQLAERAGIPIPRQRGPEADADARRRAALLEMHEIAGTFFQQQLNAAEGRHARVYLQRRGVADAMVAEFRLGYAPTGGNALLRLLEQRGYAADLLEASGLVARRDSGGFYDRFRGRLMFPIMNEAGKVIAFGGRALSDEDQPKYLNSAESPIYHKSRVLFNFHRAREAMRRDGRVVLVEGYMDAIAVFSAGVPNVVASCGTSLTLLHVKALTPMVKTVVVNYDPDTAGSAATERSLSTLLEEALDARVLALPEGQDPDEFIKVRGAEAYREALAAAPSFFSFLAARARKRFDVSIAAGRTEAARFLLPYVNKLPDALQRAELAKDLADELGLDRQLVGRELASAAAERRTWKPATPVKASTVEKELLRFVLADAEGRASILNALGDDDLWATWVTRPIFAALSRMADDFDATTLLGRLEPPEQALLAAIVNDEAVENIDSIRAGGYVSEMKRVKHLNGLREQKRRELAEATAASPTAPERDLALARIAFEIKKIEAEINAAHRVLRD